MTGTDVPISRHEPVTHQPAKTACAKVGVIIPVYNRPAIVLEAIHCVLRQSAKVHRLVIVDDGSTDATSANIDAHITEQNPAFEVKLIRQPRGGVSAARNRAAAELTDCDVLAMIDSDDLWPNDYLSRMVEPFARDASVAASFCDQQFVDTRTGQHRHRDLSVYASDTTRRMFLYGPPTPSCTVVRGDLFRKLGGYDQTLTCSEDYDLHLRLSLEGRWAYVPGLKVQIRRATGVDQVTAHHLTEIRDVRIATQRTMMLERFVCELGGYQAMPRRVWRTALARQWLGLAALLREGGHGPEAGWCSLRAVKCAPWNLCAWSSLLRDRPIRGTRAPSKVFDSASTLLGRSDT
jgi:hypothetical protein